MKRISTILLLFTILFSIGISVSAADYDCAAGNHKYVPVSTTEPTPTKDGEIHYKCELCGYEYSKVLYATAHVWSDWIIDIPAGCTENGHKYRICKVGAEHIEEETIPPAGHDYTAEIKEPSCLEDGMKIYTCQNCGDTYKEMSGHAHGHSYIEEITTEPTEFEEGIKTFTCAHCGDSYTEQVPKLNHTHDYEILSEQPPECETEGKTVLECTICDNTYTKTEAAIGHDYGEWIIIKNPNLTEEGLRQRVCAHDANHIIEETLPKAITFEITPTTVATATVNFGMIAFFLVSIFSDIYVIRWDIKKRKELKEKLREQRRRERERRKLEGIDL